MASPPHAPAPVPIYLCGSKPGVFDPTQPTRLLRYLDSTLIFASFNPLTFTGVSLCTDALTRARRVVVEVPHANDFSERPNWFSFVPNAVLAPGVASEGKWPRVVNYCGRWVVCDQDQWDIHKLDPVYDCFVPTAGMYPSITKKISAQFPGGGAQTRPGKREFSPEGDLPTPFHVSKKLRGGAAPYPQARDGQGHHTGPDIPMGETTSATSSVPPSSARPEPSATPPRSSRPNAKRRKTPAPAHKNAPHKKSQAAANTPEIVDMTMDDSDDDPVMTSPSGFTGAPDSYPGKRKTLHRTGSDQSSSSTSLPDTERRQKRPREVSPVTLKAEFEKKKAQRKRDHGREAVAPDDLAMKERNNQFWAEILASVVENTHINGESLLTCYSDGTSSLVAGSNHASGPSAQPAPQSTPGPEPSARTHDDAEARRQASIMESRQKMADLEKDKPLWYVEEEKRRRQVRAKEQACRAHQVAHEQTAAQDAAAAELPRRQAQAAADARARAHAVYARLEPERRQRRQEHRELWMPWTRRRAIDRYLAVSEQFDSTRFTHENPVDLLFIPWPVLHSPFTLHVAQVDWQMVEAFFAEASRQMCREDYRAFVAESHRRFHPDRWRSRGVFRTYDGELAQALEQACTIVSQALTPIWAASKSW
ncbi:hypothetical protein LXA43DRAFT_894168 [Ganoderma leucocontextum]|nr:hypothetical protein LXA43DRAFT_894168 [Ganoderma leucocontextum]